MNSEKINTQSTSDNPTTSGVSPNTPKTHQKAGGKSMDLKQEITNKIIALMENEESEFRERWRKVITTGGLPYNARTSKYYNGINVLLLNIEKAEKGYVSNAWMTYRQALELGGHVRKGEKGIVGVYFQTITKETELKDDEDVVSYPMMKSFVLFNAEQVDGLDKEKLGIAEKIIEKDSFVPIEEAEAIIKATGATFSFGHQEAGYIAIRDRILMPEKEAFYSQEMYYLTAFHELVHWTGHESRLNRNFSGRFGGAAYAFEELIAEIGAAFLGAVLGFSEDLMPDHAQYVKSWIQILKNDKSAIFTASNRASKAFDYILKREAANT